METEMLELDVQPTVQLLLRELTFEKVLVTGILFVLAFLILSPRSLKPKRWKQLRLKHRTESKEWIQVVPVSPKLAGKSIFSPKEEKHSTTATTGSATATLCTGMVLSLEDEEETEEEAFLQLWPAIRSSPYRRLVLPPVCKVVDNPRPTKTKDEPKAHRDIVLDEDHPLRRLRVYAQQLSILMRSLVSYDYVSAGWTLLQWFHTCLRMRYHKPHPVMEDEPDEDEAASVVTYESTMQRPANSPFKSPLVIELPSLAVEEEKKDETLTRQASTASHYEGPPNDLGESDVGEKTPISPLQLPSLSRTKSAGKRKDALESYRGTTVFLGQSPLAPRSSLPPPATVTFDVTDSAPERTDSPTMERKRADSDFLSYFDAAHSRDSLKQMSVEVPVPDRNGYILGDEFLPNSRHTPLLVFVNSRSGPQQGQLLITQLRRLLNPIQVWDLARGSPEKVLESFCVMSRLRILVCGGDGTVSWIISALEKMAMERWPPIAILPLGTGNDLARIHGWGGGYNNESLIVILEQLSEAYISLLDRWEMTVEDKSKKIKEAKSFTNYLGVGVDAQAALQVHMLRESKPKLFFSRAVNKAWYAIFGAEDAIKASHANLPHEITLIADGVEVPLPSDSQGIILLNIDSYAGGIPMWSHGTKGGTLYDARRYSEMQAGNRDGELGLRRTLSLDSIQYDTRSKVVLDRVDSLDDIAAVAFLTEEEKLARVTACDMPSSCQDGMLDIVSIRGAFHLGQIRVGLSNAQKLCQCREVTIVIKKKTAVQIDGEPWRQTVCTLHIRRKKDPAIMLHRSADESGGVETEMAKLLDWAEDRQIIDRNVHSILMKEFSRRIESKTRQRRVRSQDNLMLSLKRAIANTNSFPSSHTFPGSITF